jgi:ribA/ribD-fused uncharacterized protein
MLRTPKAILFHGINDEFSNLYRCSFVHETIEFGCVEQAYMLAKAAAFKDEEIITRLISERDPFECKKLGQMVSNFDAKVWGDKKVPIMYVLNLAKYQQNPHLKELLLGTGSLEIAEASPSDLEWGIGLAAEFPGADEPRHWHGKNLMGRVLKSVRSKFRGEDVDPIVLFKEPSFQKLAQDAGLF